MYNVYLFQYVKNLSRLKHIFKEEIAFSSPSEMGKITIGCQTDKVLGPFKIFSQRISLAYVSVARMFNHVVVVWLAEEG